MVEEAFDIGLNHPLRSPVGDDVRHPPQRIVRAALRAKAIRAVAELGFPDRLQGLAEPILDQAVLDARDGDCIMHLLQCGFGMTLNRQSCGACDPLGQPLLIAAIEVYPIRRSWFALMSSHVSTLNPVIDDMAADAKFFHQVVDGQLLGVFERRCRNPMGVAHPLNHRGSKGFAGRTHEAVTVELRSDLLILQGARQGPDLVDAFARVADLIGDAGWQRDRRVAAGATLPANVQQQLLGCTTLHRYILDQQTQQAFTIFGRGRGGNAASGGSFDGRLVMWMQLHPGVMRYAGQMRDHTPWHRLFGIALTDLFTGRP